MSSNDKQRYTLDPHPLPLALYSDGPRKEWYRVPSWRITIKEAPALEGIELRVHRGLGGEAVWTLSEATTGFKLYDGWTDEPEDTMEDMLDEFVAVYLPKLTADMVKKSVAGATALLATLPPNPFLASAVTDTNQNPTAAPERVAESPCSLEEGGSGSPASNSGRADSSSERDIPRDPTMDMKEAGRAVHHAQQVELESGKLRMRFDLVSEIWRAMYDAAPSAITERKS